MPVHRYCVGCQSRFEGRGLRCADCAARRQREQPARPKRRPGYNQAERERRARTVAAHRAVFGDWCPGYQRPAHPSTDLTADHIVSVAAGGSEGGDLTVLCRGCNGRKGAR